MKLNSRMAIYKLEKLEYKIKNDDGEDEVGVFYKATLAENTYNPKRPFRNKWELSFYDCIINSELELEVANFDLGVDEKNKLSFENISNPAKSIIRILEFEISHRTAWKGRNQLRTKTGFPITNKNIIVRKIEYDKVGFKSEERLLTLEKQKSEKFKKDNRKLRSEITKLNKMLSELEKEILEKNKALNSIRIGYNLKDNEPMQEEPLDELVFEDI